MKKLIFIFVFALFSCSIINQNIKARKMLTKCKYKIEDIKLIELKVFDHLTFNNNDVIDIKKKNYKKVLLKQLPNIKASKFKLKLNHANMDVYLNIKNTTNHEVALDHVKATIFVDKLKLTTFQHKKFTRIEPGEAKTEIINVNVPFEQMSNFQLKKPKKITIHARVFITILLGKTQWETPFEISIKKSVPFPYKAISKAVNKKKETLKKELIKEAARFLKKGIKKGVRKGLKKLFK